MPTRPSCSAPDGRHASPRDLALPIRPEAESFAPASDPRASSATEVATRGWDARLEIAIAKRGAASVAVHRRHRGPLRLQKPLYPEGPGIAHLLVVHPPAGIAGGDRLAIDITVGAGSHALVTTPGAAKWYRSDGPVAQQAVTLAVARDACLEWLPQEGIVFDGARAAMSTSIACERGATCIGWDIVALGRVASGERYARGRVGQDLSLACDGRVVWRDRVRIAGGDSLLASPVGWAGYAVGGMLWAWGGTLADVDLARCRDLTMARAAAGITVLGDGLVVARALADSAESVRALFEELWTIIRPALTPRHAVAPRIWAT